MTSTDYPENGSPTGAVGTAGEFTFAANGVSDVEKYVWGLNVAEPSQTVTASSLGGSVSQDVVPDQPGTNRLQVYSLDRAGNRSPTYTYEFQVPLSSPVGHWKFDEPSGTAAADAVGGFHPATVTGATRSPGRYPDRDANPATTEDWAITLDGTTASAATGSAVLDTTAGFSVSAWVRLTNAGAERVAVSQDGTAVSGFWLGYDPTAAGGQGRFVFARATTDNSAAPGWVKATAISAQPLGTWVHLTGVYNPNGSSGGPQLQLYVNGEPRGQQITPFTGGFAAPGVLRFGRGQSAGYWAGDVDDVRVFAAPLSDDEVYAVKVSQA